MQKKGSIDRRMTYTGHWEFPGGFSCTLHAAACGAFSTTSSHDHTFARSGWMLRVTVLYINLYTKTFTKWSNFVLFFILYFISILVFTQDTPLPPPPYETCAVVGSSGILLGSRCGAEIDKMAFVYRLDGFLISFCWHVFQDIPLLPLPYKNVLYIVGNS